MDSTATAEIKGARASAPALGHSLRTGTNIITLSLRGRDLFPALQSELYPATSQQRAVEAAKADEAERKSDQQTQSTFQYRYSWPLSASPNHLIFGRHTQHIKIHPMVLIDFLCIHAEWNGFLWIVAA